MKSWRGAFSRTFDRRCWCSTPARRRRWARFTSSAATPPMGPLQELSWEDFSRAWDVDVRGGFHWVQQALRLPLPRGSRVIIASSGAALNGSPLSGSYAGAKRMLWLMAHYANDVAQRLDLGIRFQAILPQQIIGDTELGRKAAEAYARRQGVRPEVFLAGFGAPMPPRKVGDHVVSILTDPRYATGVAFGMKGDLGIISLDAWIAEESIMEKIIKQTLIRYKDKPDM